jgi:hypothetical protein
VVKYCAISAGSWATPASEGTRHVEQPPSVQDLHAASAIVLIQEHLQSIHDIAVIGRERAGAHEAGFLASPMTHEDRAFGIFIYKFQYPHRLEHNECAGSIVGCSRRAIPGVQMCREYDKAVRSLDPAQFGDYVSGWHFTQLACVGIYSDDGGGCALRDERGDYSPRSLARAQARGGSP